MYESVVFSVQACRVQRTSQAYTLHYSLTKPIFFLFHSSCHSTWNVPAISRLRMTGLSLIPDSAVCSYSFTPFCERAGGKEDEKDNDGSPFITGTPVGKAFWRQMKGRKKERIVGCESKIRCCLYGFKHPWQTIYESLSLDDKLKKKSLYRSISRIGICQNLLLF